MTLPIGLTLIVLGGLNLLAFAAQGIDKRRAEQGRPRIPERTLAMLGMPLAAPGMLLGMRAFRHKTRKAAFLAKAVMVLFANLLMAAAIGWLAMAGHIRFSPVLY